MIHRKEHEQFRPEVLAILEAIEGLRCHVDVLQVGVDVAQRGIDVTQRGIESLKLKLQLIYEEVRPYPLPGAAVVKAAGEP